MQTFQANSRLTGTGSSNTLLEAGEPLMCRRSLAYCLQCIVLRSGSTSRWQEPRARCSIQSSRRLAPCYRPFARLQLRLHAGTLRTVVLVLAARVLLSQLARTAGKHGEAEDAVVRLKGSHLDHDT